MLRILVLPEDLFAAQPYRKPLSVIFFLARGPVAVAITGHCLTRRSSGGTLTSLRNHEGKQLGRREFGTGG